METRRRQAFETATSRLELALAGILGLFTDQHGAAVTGLQVAGPNEENRYKVIVTIGFEGVHYERNIDGNLAAVDSQQDT